MHVAIDNDINVEPLLKMILITFCSNSSGSKETSTTASGNSGVGSGPRSSDNNGMDTARDKGPTVPSIHDKYTDLMEIVIDTANGIRSDRSDENNPSLSEMMDIKIRYA